MRTVCIIPPVAAIFSSPISAKWAQTNSHTAL